MLFIQLFAIAIIIFFAVDMFWLGFVAKKFYNDQLGFLFRDKINWWAAIIFYTIFVIFLVYFVILNAIANQSIGQAALNGLLFGFITYATYDLTNLSTLKNWPLKVTIVDMIWGALLSMIVSVSTYYIYFIF